MAPNHPLDPDARNANATQAPRRRRIRLGAVLFAALAVTALLVPIAAAEPAYANRDQAADRRPTDRATHDRERPVPAAIRLDGVGTGADNATYNVSLLGHGLLRAHSLGENLTAFRGVAKVQGNVTAADGPTVAATDGFRIYVRAVETSDGAWRWQLVSFARTPFFGIPRLALHGIGDGPENGTLAIQGAGFALVKSEPTDERLRLRLDVAGSVSRA